MILKQVIRYPNADAIEATWVEQIQLPDVQIPAVPAEYDANGNETKPAQPARTEPGGFKEVVVKCHAYANSQMDMLAADLGADAPQYQALIDEIAATYIPPVFDLAAAKAVKNAYINENRLRANRGEFSHGGKQFSCDELSRSDIDGITSCVTLVSALPPGWPGGWKAVDNTYHPITTVADWADFVSSMVAAGNANFAKAQSLKAALSAATTKVEIDSIIW